MLLIGGNTQQEVIGMSMLIAFFMMAMLAAIVFTSLGYVKRQPILALFGVAFFFIVGGIAYSQSVSTWDVWYDLMFVSFIFGGLIAMVAFSLERTERATRRAKTAADRAEATRPRTTQEQWDKEQQDANDTYHSTHLPSARRHSKRRN